MILSANYVPHPLAIKKGQILMKGSLICIVPQLFQKHDRNIKIPNVFAMFWGLWQTHIVALPVKFDKVFIKQRRNIGKRTFQGYPDETTHWLIEMSTLSQQWAVGAQPHNFPLLSF